MFQLWGGFAMSAWVHGCVCSSSEVALQWVHEYMDVSDTALGWLCNEYMSMWMCVLQLWNGCAVNTWVHGCVCSNSEGALQWVHEYMDVWVTTLRWLCSDYMNIWMCELQHVRRLCSEYTSTWMCMLQLWGGSAVQRPGGAREPPRERCLQAYEGGWQQHPHFPQEGGVQVSLLHCLDPCSGLMLLTSVI